MIFNLKFSVEQLANFVQSHYGNLPQTNSVCKFLSNYDIDTLAHEAAFSKLSHMAFPNYVPGFRGFIRRGTEFGLVTEEVHGISLEYCITFSHKLPSKEQQLLHWAILSQLILYCWSKRLIFIEHFDLHPKNILIRLVGNKFESQLC